MKVFPVSNGTVQFTGSGDLMFICSGDFTLVGSGGDLTTGESSKKWSFATEALRCEGISSSEKFHWLSFCRGVSGDLYRYRCLGVEKRASHGSVVSIDRMSQVKL